MQRRLSFTPFSSFTPFTPFPSFSFASPLSLAASFLLAGALTLAAGQNARADVFDQIFAEPTAAEISAVHAQWARRSQAVQGWRLEDSLIDDDFRMDIVSHRLDGNRHFAAVRFPRDYDPKSRGGYPLLVLNHGGWEGADAEWAYGAVDDCLADHFVLVPSFRGEPLYTADRSYQSTGEKSLINKDVDDIMALVSGVQRHYQGVQGTGMAAWGFSRGGGVSLVLTLRDDRFDRVVDVFGPSNILANSTMAETLREMFADGEPRGPFYDVPAYWVREHLEGRMSLKAVRQRLLMSSPLHFSGDLPRRVQLHHGARDDIVPVEESRNLHERLEGRADMIVNDYFEYRFGDHGDLRGMERRALSFLCEDRR